MEQFKHIQLIYMILKVLRYWGLLYIRNWRSYTVLILATIEIATQLHYVIFIGRDLDDMIGNLYTVVLWSTTATRGYAMVFNRKAYEAMVTELGEHYDELKKIKDPFVEKLVESMDSKGRTMTRGNLILGTLSCIGLCSCPLFKKGRALPFGASLPFIDFYATPIYEVTYIIQTMMLPLGCCMYIAPTCLSVSFCIFGIVMCQTLQHNLRKLGTNNESPEELRRDIIECIKFQKRISSYITNVNNLVKYIFLEEFLACGTLLCALLFMVIIVETTSQSLMVYANIVMVFAQILAVYWYTNECMEESSEIANAAYDTYWYTFGISEQKLIYLLIMRAQKVDPITIGNVRPMTLQLFQSLVNASYSYFTLLQRVYT